MSEALTNRRRAILAGVFILTAYGVLVSSLTEAKPVVAAADIISGLAVVGIANGWIRYLPHSRNYEEPLADQKYEILQSTLVPDASDRLLAEAERLDRLLAKGNGR